MSHTSDAAAAAQIAQAAGEVLISLRGREDNPAALKGLGDATSHSFILAELAWRFPDDAMALPALDWTLSSAGPFPRHLPRAGSPRILVSRTRPAPQAETLAAAVDATLVPMGSAGARAAAVSRGSAEVYAQAGGQYEWDSAAPAAVSRAAGLHVSRLDGSPLAYNQPDPWLPDLLICLPYLAGAVIEACRSAAR